MDSLASSVSVRTEQLARNVKVNHAISCMSFDAVYVCSTLYCRRNEQLKHLCIFHLVCRLKAVKLNFSQRK